MNFKIIFLLILFFTINSCGVKAPPVKYPETVLESYIREYTGADPTPEELARSKSKKPTEVTPKPTTTPSLIPRP